MNPPAIELTEQPIDYQALTEKVRSHQAGAVLLFLGTVREMTNSRQTVALDYEAYPKMALTEMQKIAEEAANQWTIIQQGIVHRLGYLELGEISIAVAVSCPHRSEAYAAGRFLIDELTIRVPIWKKENWSDGSTEWVHPGTMESRLPPTEKSQKSDSSQSDRQT